jgi:hypothetical protein
MNPEQTMTKQTKLTSPKADQGHKAKGATKPARVAKAADVERKNGRGVDPAAVARPTSNMGAPKATKAASPAKPPRQTKAALLRTRLAAPGGVSLAALMEVTGWQAHTLRAALSGLRKAGAAVTRRRDGEDTIYAIEPAEPATAESARDAAADDSDPAASAVDASTPSDDDTPQTSLTTEGATA